MSIQKLSAEVLRIQQCIASRSTAVVTAASSAEAASTTGADQELLQTDGQLGLLLQWAQAVCSQQGLQVLDLSRSFADGRALCFLVSLLTCL